MTNTPVRQAGSVLKCPNDRKDRLFSVQATYPCGVQQLLAELVSSCDGPSLARVEV